MSRVSRRPMKLFGVVAEEVGKVLHVLARFVRWRTMTVAASWRFPSCETRTREESIVDELAEIEVAAEGPGRGCARLRVAVEQLSGLGFSHLPAANLDLCCGG